MLVGREDERRRLESLVSGARLGQSGVMLIAGEPGIGKTALLEHTASLSEGMTVVRVTGTDFEQELGYGGLSQLFGPFRGDLELLPEPQRTALLVALNLVSGPAPDRFAVGAATLGVLTRHAEHRPTAVLIDDAHLLDHLSAEAIVFAARRLVADPVLLVATLRSEEASPLLHAGLPTLMLDGLDLAAAHQLITGAGVGPPGERELAGLVDATHGNPLALLELAPGLGRRSGAGGSGEAAVLPEGPLSVTRAVTEAFRARTETLPPVARTALLVAAASHGDRLVVTRACRELGVDPTVLVASVDAGLLAGNGPRLAFRHPLVRAAVYQAAEPTTRRRVHAALAAALAHDPDRQAWHRGAAATGLDAGAASALEEVGHRAQARAAYDVAASALVRAAWLSPARGDRARRLVEGAEAAWVAGQGGRARELLDLTLEEDLAPGLAARSGRLRGDIEARTGHLDDALRVLRHTAEQAAPVAPEAAVELWADGVNTAFYRMDSAYLTRAVAALEELLPVAGSDRSRVLIGLAVGMANVLLGRGGADQIREAVAELIAGSALREDPARAPWLVLGPLYLREEGRGRGLVDEVVAEARRGVVLGTLPRLLLHVGLDHATSDRWPQADSEYHEGIALAREAGLPADLALLAGALAMLEGRSGRVRECREHAAQALELGERHGVVVARIWALVALVEAALGQGLADVAAEHLDRLDSELRRTGVHDVDLEPAPELVEALLRAGGGDRAERAARAAREFHDASMAKGQPWALARAERALALTTGGEEAEEHYVRAAELHALTPDRFEAARTQLAHGAWLRRSRRRREARGYLAAALQTFEALGASTRAEQAAVELEATGEQVQRRGASLLTALTPQERQITELLVSGHTTRQAATALFLSPKTVEYHLRHVYAKLGVHSRSELAEAYSSSASS